VIYSAVITNERLVVQKMQVVEPTSGNLRQKTLQEKLHTLIQMAQLCR